MRTSLKFVVAPLLAVSLASISSAAVADSQTQAEEKTFTASGWTQAKSLEKARMAIQKFEQAGSVQCTEMYGQSRLRLTANVWIAQIKASCVAEEK